MFAEEISRFLLGEKLTSSSLPFARFSVNPKTASRRVSLGLYCCADFASGADTHLEVAELITFQFSLQQYVDRDRNSKGIILHVLWRPLN